MAQQGHQHARIDAGDVFADEQEKLTNEAKRVVKEQAYFMMRALDKNNLRDALKHSSNMICELRTSLLSPKHYYELYMDVVNHLLSLEQFFDEEHKRGGKRISELYELVQHAGNILPRLYLLVTVGCVYIKSQTAPAKEILRDMVEMSRGVQHPMRGLFLRNYLTQMCKDKLPENGSPFQGEGGNVEDAIEFLLQNFQEMNRLWVRLQHQGPMREREKREKERLELRILVGKTLDRVSKLEGLDVELFKNVVLPRLSEQVIGCKDQIAQQYVMDVMIQVFPDEFHLETLPQLLDVCSQLQSQVDLQSILVGLMNRLSEYFANQNSEGATEGRSVDIFQTFTDSVTQVIEKQTTLQLHQILGLQVALLNFALKCYPSRMDYLDVVLTYVSSVLEKHGNTRMDHNAVQQIQELLRIPLQNFTDVLKVLNMSTYASLMNYLQFSSRKQIATMMVKKIFKNQNKVGSLDHVTKLFEFIEPLLKDQKLEDDEEAESEDEEDFQDEQALISRLIHLVQTNDTDELFKMYSHLRAVFNTGGAKRLAYTHVPLAFGTLQLVNRTHARELQGNKGEVSCKKVFKILHQIVTQLGSSHAMTTLRLFMMCSQAADTCKFEGIAYEFVTQAFTLYEEDVTDSKAQFVAINFIIGSLQSLHNMGEENYDTLITKTCQYSAKLLKKPDQCRAVFKSSHLFWNGTSTLAGDEDEDEKPHTVFSDGKRVIECLKRSLKIADACMVTNASVALELFVEILNEYIFYFTNKVAEVTPTHMSQLVALIRDHVSSAEADDDDHRRSVTCFNNAIGYIRHRKGGEGGDLWAEVEC